MVLSLTPWPVSMLICFWVALSHLTQYKLEADLELKLRRQSPKVIPKATPAVWPHWHCSHADKHHMLHSDHTVFISGLPGVLVPTSGVFKKQMGAHEMTLWLQTRAHLSTSFSYFFLISKNVCLKQVLQESILAAFLFIGVYQGSAYCAANSSYVVAMRSSLDKKHASIYPGEQSWWAVEFPFDVRPYLM